MNPSKNFRLPLWATALVAPLFVPAACSAVIINPADSSTFTYKYEGDAATLATFGSTGYSGGTTGYVLTGDSPAPGLLDVSVDGGSATPGLIVYLQSPTFESTALDSTGWTWEASFRLKPNSGPGGAATGRFTMRIGDDAGDDAIFEILESGSIQQFSGADLGDFGDPTDGQHVYRVAQEANSNTYNLWVDGVLISDTITGGFGVGPHWFSDGSGSTQGEYELDYVRFTSGAFSPLAVPECSTAILAGIATIAAGLYRKRKRG